MISFSLFEHVKREIGKKCNIVEELLRFLKITSGESRGIITLFIFEGKKNTPSFFAKVSNRANSKGFIKNEYEALEKLTKCSDVIPKPVAFFEHGAFSVSITEFIHGRCLGNLRSGTGAITPAILGRDLGEINKTLFNLKKCYGSEKRVRLATVLGDIKERYQAVFSEDVQLVHRLNRIDEDFADLMQTEVDLYFNHGDFAIGHLITNGNGIKGIVDWEYFGKIKLPCFDVFYCYIVYYLVLSNPSMNCLSINNTDALFLDFSGDIKNTMNVHLRAYLELYNISDKLIYLLFFYSLVELFLRIKTIIGISEGDTRVEFLKEFFTANMDYYIDAVRPQHAGALAAGV